MLTMQFQIWRVETESGSSSLGRTRVLRDPEELQKRFGVCTKIERLNKFPTGIEPSSGIRRCSVDAIHSIQWIQFSGYSPAVRSYGDQRSPKSFRLLIIEKLRDEEEFDFKLKRELYNLCTSEQKQSHSKAMNKRR